MSDKKEPSKPTKKTMLEKLKDWWVAAVIVCLSIFALIAVFLSNNQICADTTFGYDGASVPAKICLVKSINYNIGGVSKSASFSEEFVKKLTIV